MKSTIKENTDKTISNVFNKTIWRPSYEYEKVPNSQRIYNLAGLYEQLLLFDKVTIYTDPSNKVISELIKMIGINTAEELIEKGYINFMLWTPLIATNFQNNNEFDSPIGGGTVIYEEFRHIASIDKVLTNINITKDRRSIFINKVIDKYIVPDGLGFAQDSATVAIDAYKRGSLTTVGLPYNKEPQKLDILERNKLRELASVVLETSILSAYNLKSSNSFKVMEIYKHNLHNIGKAYNVIDNNSHLFEINGLPNLRQLFINEKLRFDNVFKLRQLSSAKYYRKWLNEVGENSDKTELTKEFINEIKGSTQYFDNFGCKFVKTVLMFGASTALGKAIAGPLGATAGFGLSMLEAFVLDNLLIGKNPAMFIDKVKTEVNKLEIRSWK